MKKFMFMILLSACLFFVGCAQKRMTVVYDSIPEYAGLYAPSGEFLGEAPVTKIYKITDYHRMRGNVSISNLTAKWLSGAEVSGGNTIFNVDGKSKKHIFIRPHNASGLKNDMEYANGKNINKNMQKSIEEQRKSRDQSGLLGLGLLCVLAGSCR